MASPAADVTPPPAKKRTPRHHLRQKKKPENTLPWNQSIPSDDPFSLLIGSTEGGFLSLEEIDESEYGLVTGSSDNGEGESASHKAKKRKRKSGDGDGSVDEASVLPDVADEEEVEDEEKCGGKKRKKRKKKKKKSKEGKESEAGEISVEKTEGSDAENLGFASIDAQEPSSDSDSKDQPVVNEDEYWAWKELRLHPLLMKAIYKRNFKEPTAIQKACIPAAAHRGKDVIGAAETGSGKTLAFGLPILQRLLEETEKAETKAGNVPETVEEGVKGSPIRALVVTPTRELALQICSHLREMAVFCNIHVVPIVGGIYAEKQERLLRKRPDIVVGTPGRLWELMSGGQQHLVELNSLSFFVLDEADRMVEKGHFRELQSIIDMLPTLNGSVEHNSLPTQDCKTVPNLAIKKRQTFVFSATIALAPNFRKKLKHGSLKSKSSSIDGVSSIETLSERAGIRADAAIIDLTNTSIVAHKLEESFIECKEEDKETYLYYLLSVHGHGQTIIFCTSIAALQRISSLLRVLAVNVWTLHAQMQQRARLKAIDRFRASEHGTLVATDVAARGIDIPGVRTVVHFQLPHSADVYVHRSGRTARASADGCSIALISPKDKLKFTSLCKSFSKETLQRFPVDSLYMPEVFKRVTLARQIDKLLRMNSHKSSEKSWLERNAESAELFMEDSDSEEEHANNSKRKKQCSLQLKNLQQELNKHLAQPLQPKTFSRRFLAGAGVSLVLQQQLQELAGKNLDGNVSPSGNKRSKLVVIGQNCIEPLQALRSGGQEVSVGITDVKEKMEKFRNRQTKKREQKKRLHEQRRKQRRKMNN